MTLFGPSNIAEQSLTLLNWAMQTGAMISLLIVIILIIRRPFAKMFGPRAVYALWVLPALRLFMPTVSVPEHWLFWRAEQTSIVAVPMEAVSPPLDIPMAMMPPIANASFDWASIGWPAPIVFLWLIGAIIWLGWQARLYGHARRDLMDSSDAADLSIAQLASQCAARLGLKRLPKIRLAYDNRGPMVMGLLKPLVILPHDCVENFTAQQQRFTLMHELAHIRRRDLWAALGALIFRAVNWPNPLVHYALRAFRTDQEAACDASVLDKIGGDSARGAYGQTLLRAATLNYSSGQNFTDVPIGLTLNHPLKERLMALRNPMKKTNFLTKTAIAAALFAGCASTASYSVAKSDTLDAPITKRVQSITVNQVDGTMLFDTNYEVTLDGDTYRAWKIDPKTGEKAEISLNELNDIPGINIPRDAQGEVKLVADEMHYVPVSQAPEPPTEAVPTAPSVASVVPLRLDGFITLSNNEEPELQHLRALAKSGRAEDKKALMDWMGSHADRGQFTYAVGRVGGEGYTFGKNVKPTQQAALTEATISVLKRCADYSRSNTLPLSYYAELSLSGTSKSSGKYMMTCTPGTKAQRDALTIEQEVEGIMASTDIPIGTRNARAYGMEIGHFFAITSKRTDISAGEKKRLNTEFTQKMLDKYKYGSGRK